MELGELIAALIVFDALKARQWVADAMRMPIQWSVVPYPVDMDATELAIAAGVAEMLAQRMNQQPPLWTKNVKSSPVKLYLVQAAKSMSRLKRLCEQEGPESLRKRHILAPPDFLSIA